MVIKILQASTSLWWCGDAFLWGCGLVPADKCRSCFSAGHAGLTACLVPASCFLFSLYFPALSVPRAGSWGLRAAGSWPCSGCVQLSRAGCCRLARWPLLACVVSSVPGCAAAAAWHCCCVALLLGDAAPAAGYWSL